LIISALFSVFGKVAINYPILFCLFYAKILERVEAYEDGPSWFIIFLILGYFPNIEKSLILPRDLGSSVI